MIELVFKILAICLITAAICVILKQQGSEYALLVSVGAGIIIFLCIFRAVSLPIEALKKQLENLGVEAEYFKVAIKAVGISYVTGFIADACRDSGQTSLASKAELVGKCAIFSLSVPLIMSILETAVGFLRG